MARAIGYPQHARFHAVYHDLVEDVDYNYVQAPIKLYQGGQEALGPVDVFAYDSHGETSIKRTLPVIQTLHASFPPRVLVLRHFIDWMIHNRDTTCLASSSPA